MFLKELDEMQTLMSFSSNFRAEENSSKEQGLQDISSGSEASHFTKYFYNKYYFLVVAHDFHFYSWEKQYANKYGCKIKLLYKKLHPSE